MKANFNSSCTKVFGTHLLRRGGGGQGGRADPHDFENGRLYSLQLWEAIRTIYERLKTGRVNDLILVRFPWQLIYLRVLSTKFC